MGAQENIKVVRELQQAVRDLRPLALSIFCDHDFARLELPDPLGLRPPEIKYRCQNCLGLVDRLPRGYSARAA